MENAHTLGCSMPLSDEFPDFTFSKPILIAELQEIALGTDKESFRIAVITQDDVPQEVFDRFCRCTFGSNHTFERFSPDSHQVGEPCGKSSYDGQERQMYLLHSEESIRFHLVVNLYYSAETQEVWHSYYGELPSAEVDTNYPEDHAPPHCFPRTEDLLEILRRPNFFRG